MHSCTAVKKKALEGRKSPRAFSQGSPEVESAGRHFSLVWQAKYSRKERLFARLVDGGNSFTYPAFLISRTVKNFGGSSVGAVFSLSTPLVAGTRRVTSEVAGTVVRGLVKVDIECASYTRLVAHHIFQNGNYSLLTLQSARQSPWEHYARSPCSPAYPPSRL